MRLPNEWENFLNGSFDLKKFYDQLDAFIKSHPILIPTRENIFNVFNYMHPRSVRCVLFGEDPYPRNESACGVAFWDKQINSWNDKTNGNSLKNILKALLVHNGKAVYSNSIGECRDIVKEIKFVSPPQLFDLWLKQGVLLINSALTFSGNNYKKSHLVFWKPFNDNLIKKLNAREVSPFYILWGKKAQTWQKTILKSIDNSEKIINQGHPTFIHQFMKKESDSYSPFSEIITKTKIKWY